MAGQALGCSVRLDARRTAGSGWAAVAQTPGQALLFYCAKSIWDLPAAAVGWLLLSELAHLTFMYLNTALQYAA